VHPSHHEEYANRIVSILKSDALYAQIGSAARIFVTNRFDVEKVVCENIQLYKSKIIKK
jgi:glycosyltransferase involved in cell wall biosynthesis